MHRLSIVLAVLISTTSAIAKPGDVKHIATDRLAGVWLVPDPESDTVAARLIVMAGEFDAEGPEGLAHYTEHLVYHQARTANSDGRPRHGNAWTTDRRTVYWSSGTSDELDQVLAPLARVFEPLSVSEEYARTERDVVMREYGARYASNWRAQLGSDARRDLHANTPWSRSVIGSPESIASLTLVRARQFHAQHYGPENAVLLVTGKVSKRKLRKAVRRHFLAQGVAELSDGGSYLPPDSRDIVERRHVEALTQGEELWWMRAVDLPEPGDTVELSLQLRLLRHILNSRLDGGLARALRYDDFVLSRFGIDFQVHSDRYLSFNLRLHPDVGITPAEALVRCRAFFSDLAKNGIPKSTLDRIKVREIEQINRQPLTALAFNRAEYGLETRRKPESVRALIRRIRHVSTADLQLLLNALGAPSREVVYTITPEEPN